MSELTREQVGRIAGIHRQGDEDLCRFCAEPWPCDLSRIAADYLAAWDERDNLRTALEEVVAAERQRLRVMRYPVGELTAERLTFDRLRAANIDRCETSFYPLEDWSLTDWATAAAGELGETCNLIKKLRRGEMIAVEKIGQEIADTVIYLDLLTARLGLDLGEVVRTKFNVVSDRVESEVRL